MFLQLLCVHELDVTLLINMHMIVENARNFKLERQQGTLHGFLPVLL